MKTTTQTLSMKRPRTERGGLMTELMHIAANLAWNAC